jgi:hypothetical protein
LAGTIGAAAATSCALPWQDWQPTPAVPCTLAGARDASSAWQEEHSTFATFSGCGKSLMVVWQSLQPKIPWTLAACLAGSTEMLLPLADVIPAWPWHAKHSWSLLLLLAGEAEANAGAKANTKQTKATRVTRISTLFS